MPGVGGPFNCCCSVREGGSSSETPISVMQRSFQIPAGVHSMQNWIWLKSKSELRVNLEQARTVSETLMWVSLVFKGKQSDIGLAALQLLRVTESSTSGSECACASLPVQGQLQTVPSVPSSELGKYHENVLFAAIVNLLQKILLICREHSRFIA